MNMGMPRRYAAELVGTFGIVFAPVALGGAAGLKGADGGLMAAPGLAVDGSVILQKPQIMGELIEAMDRLTA